MQPRRQFRSCPQVNAPTSSTVTHVRLSTRARLEQALQQIPVAEIVVLTSSDGVVATLAAADDWAQKRNEVRVLRSGNTGWVDAGMSMVADPVRLADEADDYWKTPLDPNRQDGKTIEQAMNDYLSWEVALDEQIERDATTRFSRTVTRALK
jgi:hypothetical protein